VNNLAPIILFVYNRPDHTRKTIEALVANKYANESELIIYSDAPKNQKAEEGVQAVRFYIKKVRGFKSLSVIERDKNWGLANSIIDGVTNIVNQYGKVIVLEDDIVTSPYFLKFMNDGLNYYENVKNVWHISGWNHPIGSEGLRTAFFWRTMDCWGWATWHDRWQYFEKNVDKLIMEFSKKDIYKFNMNNSEDIWSQVLSNKAGKINTWAVFWYATIFKKKGLCLNPTISFVNNIGFDGTGVNCGKTTLYDNNLDLNKKEIDFATIPIKEEKFILKRIMAFYGKGKKNIIKRAFLKILRLIKKPFNRTKHD
jgi:hypothetical protein